MNDPCGIEHARLGWHTELERLAPEQS
jgi:hypothetical protein